MELDRDTPLGSEPNDAVTRKTPTNTHIVEHSARDRKVVGSDGLDQPPDQGSDNDGGVGIEAHRNVRGSTWALIVV